MANSEGTGAWSESMARSERMRISNPSSMASSANGLSVALTHWDNDSGLMRLKTSTDGGQTWTDRSAPAGFVWSSGKSPLASSADGSVLYSVAARSGYGMWMLAKSTDGGVSWTLLTSAGERYWRDVATSADGRTVYAGDGGRAVYRSLDGGVSWSLVFRPNGDFVSLETNSSGTEFYAWRRNALTGSPVLFSSALTAFTEINGSRALKLIYLGGDTFAQE